MADDEDLEYTLLNKRDVMVYQIPPASSSAGHKADDWKKCIWRGRCRIAGKGSDLSIKMLDASSGQLFAQCAIPNGEYEKYVERVIDSSRYFVLKITNGARHAFIGLGFEDRNDAFDFNCTLNDFKSTWVNKDKQADADAEAKPDQPAKDLSLKEGQKITINLPGLSGSRKREDKADGGDGGFAGLLAPPPSGGQSRRQPAAGQAPILQPPPAAASVPAARAPAQSDDFFGDFDDFQSAGAAPAAAPPAAAAAAPAQVASLTSQLGDLNFGAAPPAPAPAQVQAPAAAAPQQSTDPFANFGGPSQPAALAAPGAPAAAVAPAPQKAGFDEFDIFK